MDLKKVLEEIHISGDAYVNIEIGSKDLIDFQNSSALAVCNYQNHDSMKSLMGFDNKIFHYKSYMKLDHEVVE